MSHYYQADSESPGRDSSWASKRHRSRSPGEPAQTSRGWRQWPSSSKRYVDDWGRWSSWSCQGSRPRRDGSWRSDDDYEEGYWRGERGGGGAGGGGNANCQEGTEAEDEEQFFYRPGHQVTQHDIVLLPAGSLGQSGWSNAPRFVLLFLHSRSHGPEDVQQYVPHLWETGLNPRDVKILAPCSPSRPEGQDESWPTNSWFDYTTNVCWTGKKADRVDFDQLVEQRERILRLLEEEQRLLPPGGRIVIGGLSQGVSLALDVVLHAPTHLSIAGCFCLRGMMQEESLWSLSDHKVQHWARHCPVFTFHGKADAIVPFKLASHSYRRLEDLGFRLESHAEVDLSHSGDSLLELRQVGRFVASSLTASE